MTLHLAPPPDWMQQAKCKGMVTDGFFPDRGQHEAFKQAKAICYTCPVRAECLTYAMQNGEKYGVWGGYSERERRAMRKRFNQRMKATA